LTLSANISKTDESSDKIFQALNKINFANFGPQRTKLYELMLVGE